MAKYCVLHKKFAAVLNLTQNPKQKITHIASIFTQLCAFVRQLKIFQWTQKSGIFYGTRTDQNMKRDQHCILPLFTCLCVFRNRYLHLVDCRV